jgi:hypothetical protein
MQFFLVCEFQCFFDGASNEPIRQSFRLRGLRERNRVCFVPVPIVGELAGAVGGNCFPEMFSLKTSMFQ